MMPVRVLYHEIACDVADIHSGKKQRSIIEYPQAVATAPVIKDRSSCVHSGRLQWITAPDPGLNREILKLQIRRVADDNTISSAVEFKCLCDHSRNKGRVSLQIPGVCAPDITPVRLGWPRPHDPCASG